MWSAGQHQGEDPNNKGLRQKHSSTTTTGLNVPEAPCQELSTSTGESYGLKQWAVN